VGGGGGGGYGSSSTSQLFLREDVAVVILTYVLTYRVFPVGRKRPGRDADPSPPYSAGV
jgi:hypothetical protein